MTLDAASSSYESATVDGFTVSSNTATTAEIAENLKADAAPRDGDPEQDEAARVSKAAAELGKKGGKAAAEARAARQDDLAAESTDDEEEAEEAPAAKDKPRNSARERMLQATRKEAEAKRQLAEERAERQKLAERLEALERGRTEQPKAEAPKRQALPDDPSDPKPKAEEFDEYEDFVEARGAWAARRQIAEATKAAQERRMREEVGRHVQEADKSFAGRLAEAEKADPDFRTRLTEEVLSIPTRRDLKQGEQITALHVVGDEIYNSERGAALMLHLSQHPEVLQRLASLPSTRAVTREMAKLEDRLEAVTTAPSSTTAVSKAFPPVRPVTGSPTTGSDPDSDEENFDAMARRRLRADRPRR